MKPIFSVALVLVIASIGLAQSGGLRGRVTDQDGAVVPGAKVTLNGPAGLVKTGVADSAGGYSFAGLPPGEYLVRATARSLATSKPASVTVKSGSQTLDLQLSVVALEEK